MDRRKQEEKMKRDELNDRLLEYLEKQRVYFKTVKDFQEVNPLLIFIISNSI